MFSLFLSLISLSTASLSTYLSLHLSLYLSLYLHLSILFTSLSITYLSPFSLCHPSPSLHFLYVSIRFF